MKTYVVTVQHPYDEIVMKYLQSGSFKFSVKEIEGGSVFLVGMMEREKNKLLKKYKSVTVTEPDLLTSILDLEDESEVPFPQIMPDNPNSRSYYIELGVVIGLAVLVIGLAIFWG